MNSQDVNRSVAMLRGEIWWPFMTFLKTAQLTFHLKSFRNSPYWNNVHRSTLPPKKTIEKLKKCHMDIHEKSIEKLKKCHMEKWYDDTLLSRQHISWFLTAAVFAQPTSGAAAFASRRIWRAAAANRSMTDDESTRPFGVWIPTSRRCWSAWRWVFFNLERLEKLDEIGFQTNIEPMFEGSKISKVVTIGFFRRFGVHWTSIPATQSPTRI